MKKVLLFSCCFFGMYWNSVESFPEPSEDPCSTSPCGIDAHCQATATVTVCFCPDDRVGDPFEECKKIEDESSSSSSPSSSSPSQIEPTTEKPTPFSTTASTRDTTTTTTSTTTPVPSTTTTEVPFILPISATSLFSHLSQNGNPNKPIIIQPVHKKEYHTSTSTTTSSSIHDLSNNAQSVHTSQDHRHNQASSHTPQSFAASIDVSTPDLNKHPTTAITTTRIEESPKPLNTNNNYNLKVHTTSFQSDMTPSRISLMSHQQHHNNQNYNHHSNSNQMLSSPTAVPNLINSPISRFDITENVNTPIPFNSHSGSMTNVHSTKVSQNYHHKQQQFPVSNQYNHQYNPSSSATTVNYNQHDSFNANKDTLHSYSHSHGQNGQHHSHGQHQSSHSYVKDPIGQYTNCKMVNNIIACADNSADNRQSGFQHRTHYEDYGNNNRNQDFHQLTYPVSHNSQYHQSYPIKAHVDYNSNGSRQKGQQHQSNYDSNHFNNHHEQQVKAGTKDTHRVNMGNHPKPSESSSNDLCKTMCGVNSVCRVFLGRPICGCPENHSGDPSVKCTPLEPEKNSSCQRHTECKSNEICLQSVCIDPCSIPDVTKNSRSSTSDDPFKRMRSDYYRGNGSMCGHNAKCLVVQHTPLCACTEGFYGNPYVSCVA